VHPINSIDFEPDGEIVLSAYSDSIKVWDLEQRKLVSMVSKTARPVFDLKCSTEKDFTFVLENINGALGLSEIATSLLLNKNGDLQNYEEEKKVDSSPKFDNGMNYVGPGQKNNNLMNNPGSHQANQPLDFYKAPSNGAKIPNGKVINNGFDYVYGLEDSNDLENIEETSYQSPALNKENSYPKTNEQAQLPKKMSRKQKSRK
jgi:WD40 repeat protein